MEQTPESLTGNSVTGDSITEQSQGRVKIYSHSDLRAAGMRQVVIKNDDVTPYEYVVYSLIDIFRLSEELADHITMTAHTQGSAVVVVRNHQAAEKLATVANAQAKKHSYPLTFCLQA
jgi:ATP-dependent Clp protease adaptor protein ClpS